MSNESHVYARLDRDDPRVVPVCAPTTPPVSHLTVRSRPGCPECDGHVAAANALRWAREMGARVRRDRRMRGVV